MGGNTMTENIKKHFTELGILSNSVELLYSSLTGTCPGEMENHSPVTQVCYGRKGLGAPLEEMLMIQHP